MIYNVHILHSQARGHTSYLHYTPLNRGLKTGMLHFGFLWRRLGGGAASPSFRNIVVNHGVGGKSGHNQNQAVVYEIVAPNNKPIARESSRGNEPISEDNPLHPKAAQAWELGKGIPKATRMSRYEI